MNEGRLQNSPAESRTTLAVRSHAGLELVMRGDPSFLRAAPRPSCGPARIPVVLNSDSGSSARRNDGIHRCCAPPTGRIPRRRDLTVIRSHTSRRLEHALLLSSAVARSQCQQCELRSPAQSLLFSVLPHPPFGGEKRILLEGSEALRSDQGGFIPPPSSIVS